ncbi:MAG: YcxB family protein [Polyangiales bacterium]
MLDATDTITGHAVLGQSDVDGALKKTGLSRMTRFYTVMLVVGPLFLYFTHRAAGHQPQLSDFAPALGYGVLFVGVLYVAQRAAARKHLEGKSARDLTMHYELDAGGYTIRSPSTDVRSTWQSVHHFDEAEAAFLIFPSATIQVVVPKRAFAEADVPRVRALLQASVKQPKKTFLRGSAGRVILLWLALVLMFVVIYHTLGAPR